MIQSNMRSYGVLALSVLSEVTVLLAIVGLLGDVDLGNIFLGYFIGLFWFIIILSISLERQTDLKNLPKGYRHISFDLTSTLTFFGVILFWVFFLEIFSGIFSEYYFQLFSQTPSEVWSPIIFFSILAIFRSTVELLGSKEDSQAEIFYQKRKVFHDGFVKLLVGFAGILLVSLMPDLSPDTFGGMKETTQIAIYFMVFCFFILQDIWFWHIEASVTDPEVRTKKVDKVTKYLLLALVFAIFIGGGIQSIIEAS